MGRPEKEYQQHREQWRRAVRWDERISPNGRLVLLALDDYRNRETDRAFPADGTLGDETGLRRENANRWLTKATELGYLSIAEKRWSGRRRLSNVWAFHIPGDVPSWVLDSSLARPWKLASDAAVTESDEVSDAAVTHSGEVSDAAVTQSRGVSDASVTVQSDASVTGTPEYPNNNINPRGGVLTDEQKRMLGMY